MIQTCKTSAGLLRVATVFALFVVLPPVTQAQTQPATATVERLLAAFVDAAQFADVQDRFESLGEPVTTTHDLHYIGELTVRRQWRAWDDAQRGAFIAAFTELSIMTYAARFAGVGEETFRMLGSGEAGGSRIQVNVEIVRSDAAPVPLDFVLQETDAGEWKIANVLADGVSDLALKRAEYRSLLEERGFNGLIEDLRTQTEALAATE